MSRETRILLLRHAETAAPDRFHGAESDVELGERGLRQAAEAALALAALGPEAVYCSGLRRALQTAGPIAEAIGREPRVVSDLHERRMGILSGRARVEVGAIYEAARDRWHAGDLDATHEGAESYRMIRDRAVPAFLRVAEAHPGGTAVVVAHGVVIRVLLASLLEGAGPRDFERFGIDFVAVNDLRRVGETWRAAALNAPAASIGRPRGL